MIRVFTAAFMSVSFFISVMQGCKSGKVQKQQPGDRTKGLKDYYKDYFTMGVAVSPQGLKRADESQLDHSAIWQHDTGKCNEDGAYSSTGK